MDIFLIATVVILLVYVTIASYFLYKRETDTHAKEKAIYEEAQKELQRTQQKAIKIVESAVVKGRDILNQTQSFKTDIEKKSSEAVNSTLESYVEEMEKHSQELIHSYEQMFNELKDKFVEDEKTAIMQLEQAGKEEIDQFSKSIGEKTLAYEQFVEKKVNAEFQEASQMENTVKKQVDEFSKTIAQRTEQYQKQLEEKITQEIQAASQMEDVVKKEVAEFSKGIADKTLAYQQELENKVTAEFLAVQEEIKSYKEERMKKIDEGVTKITYKLALDLLGKSIRIEDHEKLVLEALDEAKKENMFTF
jgi:myosin heavy subunit